jgi:hypothetical protein
MAPKRTREEEPEFVLTYFSLFGKGPSIALALAHSPLKWKLIFPEDWSSLKPSTSWGFLPVLEAPGDVQVGHEAAILNYIGHVVPSMGGSSSADFATSQQLLFQAEDIYQKLVRVQNTIMAKDKVADAELQAFWSDADGAKHNAKYGVLVYLSSVERFLAKCGGTASGKFTVHGLTVGECKLFVVLHILKTIKDDVLGGSPGLTAFYSRIAALDKTKGFIEGTLEEMPGPFKQYFVA